MNRMELKMSIVKELPQPNKKIEYEEHGKYISCIYPYERVILKECFNIDSYDNFLESIHKYSLYVHNYNTDNHFKTTANIYDVIEAENSKDFELCYIVNDFNSILFDLKFKPIRRFFKCSKEHIDDMEDLSLKNIKKSFEGIDNYGEIKYDNIVIDYSIIFNRHGEVIEKINIEESIISFWFRPSIEVWNKLVEEAEQEYNEQNKEKNKFLGFEFDNEFSLYYYAEFLSDFIPQYIFNRLFLTN